MNYSDFLNKQIINKNNEVGVVLSFDEKYIVIKYPTHEKTYCSDVTFKTSFLTFKNKDLQKLIEQDVFAKNTAAKKKEKELADINRKYFARREKVNETYERLYAKNRMLMFFFGRDFIYPPLKEFEKKYKNLINRSY